MVFVNYKTILRFKTTFCSIFCFDFSSAITNRLSLILKFNLHFYWWRFRCFYEVKFPTTSRSSQTDYDIMVAWMASRDIKPRYYPHLWSSPLFIAKPRSSLWDAIRSAKISRECTTASILMHDLLRYHDRNNGGSNLIFDFSYWESKVRIGGHLNFQVYLKSEKKAENYQFKALKAFFFHAWIYSSQRQIYIR